MTLEDSGQATDLLPDSPIEIEPLVLDTWQANLKDQMVQKRNMGVGAEMGLGKTPPTLQAMHELNLPSCLIVVTKRAFVGWRRMMKQWFPDMWAKYQVIITRDAATRKAQWALQKDFVITTWDWFYRDNKAGLIQRKNFSQVVLDEAHKYIRGHKTKTRALLKTFSWVGIFIITGSPVSRGAEQWFSYLNLMNPKEFPSYWKWVNTFCIVIDMPFGKTIEGTKNIDSLHSILRRYFVVIEKKNLGKEKKRKQFLDAIMTPIQERAYNKMRDDMYFETGEGDFFTASTPMVQFLRMRQLLACPAILDPSLGIGGAMEAVLEELKELPRNDQHCVIFTPFRDAVPIFCEAIEEALGVRTFQFMGGLEPDELEQQLAMWRKERGIAVNVIKYSESFDQETTDKGFFVGYEWDPYDNRQAEDRIDRRNNLNPRIRIFYCRMLNTYDENVMDRLVYKSVNLNAMFNDPIKLKRILEVKSETVT